MYHICVLHIFLSNFPSWTELLWANHITYMILILQYFRCSQADVDRQAIHDWHFFIRLKNKALYFIIVSCFEQQVFLGVLSNNHKLFTFQYYYSSNEYIVACIFVNIKLPTYMVIFHRVFPVPCFGKKIALDPRVCHGWRKFWILLISNG